MGDASPLSKKVGGRRPPAFPPHYTPGSIFFKFYACYLWRLAVVQSSSGSVAVMYFQFYRWFEHNVQEYKRREISIYWSVTHQRAMRIWHRGLCSNWLTKGQHWIGDGVWYLHCFIRWIRLTTPDVGREPLVTDVNLIINCEQNNAQGKKAEKDALATVKLCWVSSL